MRKVLIMSGHSIYYSVVASVIPRDIIFYGRIINGLLEMFDFSG